MQRRATGQLRSTTAGVGSGVAVESITTIGASRTIERGAVLKAGISVTIQGAAALLAQRVRATVLLKGVPTVVADAHRTLVVAAGTPVLATGGSGDVLGGIVATLLAQTGDATAAAASGAWAHGRAAEIAGAGRIRGVNLDDVVEALANAWYLPPRVAADVLVELPAVGTR